MVIVAAVLRLFKLAARNHTRVIIIASAFFVLLGTLGSYLTESAANSQFTTIWDSLWWTLVTMSTVGYGDKVPITAAGRVIGVICMVGGPVLMVSFVSTAALAIYERWTKGVRGMARINSNNHIVVCGWNTSAQEIIDELRASDKFRDWPVTIIDDRIEKKPVDDARVTFVRGNASEVSVLRQANIEKAAYAIVLAEDGTPVADQKTVLTILAIESANPSIISCAQLNDWNNEGHLNRAGCDIIVNTPALTSRLLAMSLQNPALNKITSELVSGGRGNEIYRVELPQRYVGRSFADSLLEMKKSHDAIVIGIERDGQYRLNPPNDTVLEAADRLFVISEEAPSL
jgi:voltage-gated potassium channel